MRKIAIQGYPGSFHEIAAMQLFGENELDILPCRTFSELFTAVVSNTVQTGLVAIENSQAGSILSNYRLLRESGLKITGEYKLRIEHHLLALPGQDISDISEVHSHSMAIQQCRAFFKAYPHIRLINSADTAFSACEIRENMLRGRGAIGSLAAAERYSLEVLAPNIETNNRNFTRFLIICDPDRVGPDWLSGKSVNKASLVITLAHSRGSLARLLTHFADHKLNLTKIQSLPLIGQEWNYLFYIDLVFQEFKDYASALQSLNKYASRFQILGEYPSYDEESGKTVVDSAQQALATGGIRD
ncbi:MAG: prephenate dehydratase [FCB group bacterium]|nr:prephenate dehydratase [FCB group bacterium]